MKNRWPKANWEKRLDKFLASTKKWPRRFIGWLFFYKSKDTMDSVLHIIDVLAFAYIFTRATGILGAAIGR